MDKQWTMHSNGVLLADQHYFHALAKMLQGPNVIMLPQPEEAVIQQMRLVNLIASALTPAPPSLKMLSGPKWGERGRGPY